MSFPTLFWIMYQNTDSVTHVGTFPNIHLLIKQLIKWLIFQSVHQLKTLSVLKEQAFPYVLPCDPSRPGWKRKSHTREGRERVGYTKWNSRAQPELTEYCRLVCTRAIRCHSLAASPSSSKMITTISYDYLTSLSSTSPSGCLNYY